MTLCFAAFIKVLKICAKPKVHNKTLCEAVIKTINEYSAGIVGSDDSWVSHIMHCTYNLSLEHIIIPIRDVPLSTIPEAGCGAVT